jgi:spore maturation protein CgeB
MLNASSLDVVILGLSITSSWGNGHATIYRALVRELVRRGHRVLFLERDTPWYRAARDLPRPPFGRTVVYRTLSGLKQRFTAAIRRADLVIVGSYVPQGIEIGEWVVRSAHGVTAFYDIDTPVTLRMIERDAAPYLSRKLIPRYQLYLSFTGGPVLSMLERKYQSPMARPLYCCVDAALYYPRQQKQLWHLGYMGTYSKDRQATLDRLMLEPARRFHGARMVVAGPQYPAAIKWPANVERIEHLAPKLHRGFYNRQAFTLNVTRRCMVRAGYSPSVRLFEAAACGRPIITDRWRGIEEFFTPGEEILIADSPDATLEFLLDMPAAERERIGRRARERVLRQHTAAQRTAELESYTLERMGRRI